MPTPPANMAVAETNHADRSRSLHECAGGSAGAGVRARLGSIRFAHLAKEGRCQVGRRRGRRVGDARAPNAALRPAAFVHLQKREQPHHATHLACTTQVHAKGVVGFGACRTDGREGESDTLLGLRRSSSRAMYAPMLWPTTNIGRLRRPPPLPPYINVRHGKNESFLSMDVGLCKCNPLACCPEELRYRGVTSGAVTSAEPRRGEEDRPRAHAQAYTTGTLTWGLLPAGA
jgi:hypothetical protein